MRRWQLLALRVIMAAPLTWMTAGVFQRLQLNRSVASMALVLEVLLFATFADWLLALIVSGLASLAFSWYYVDSLNSLAINSMEGAITYCMMLSTALIGSRLAVRAQQRALEAINRREEMERLQQMGQLVVATASVQEAAADIVRKIVELFDVHGARLTIEDMSETFSAGSMSLPMVDVPLHSVAAGRALELYGARTSEEVRSALGNLVNLVLDRARNAEEIARIEASRRGDELRNTVLNALAHNFKTPLTSIKAASSVLRRYPKLAPDAHDLASVIDEEADRLSQLIRDSLDLAKLESRRENPRRELCSISDITQAVTTRAARYLEGRKLVVDVPEDLPQVWGDPFLFEQMLMQVVDNAWKYSKPGAEIRIVGSSGNGELHLTIQNQGSRIPDEERERIFGKFYRGVLSRSYVEGTGMGLAIARTIAEAHGGAIRLESEPEGPAFRFSLPVGETGGMSDRKPHDLNH